MDHAHLFAFEDDFVASLRCIPMAVRFKLDQAGVKLSLRQWSRFRPGERRSLLLQPCGAEEVDAYRRRLMQLTLERAGETATLLPADAVVPWEQVEAAPEAVRDFARSAGVEPPTDDAWRGLEPLQRFVLLKLSRANHDNVNFVPALKEFGLYREASGPARGASSEVSASSSA